MAKVIAENPLQKLWAIDKEDTELPRGTMVGANGVFHASNSAIFDIVKRVGHERLPGLKDIEEKAEVKLKIPSNDFWVGPRWLYKMWNKQKKEYIILLFFNPKTGKYSWYPPAQTGHVASLNYAQSEDSKIREMIASGMLLVGTMHNHFGNRGSAFQSGTDKHDEEKLPGSGIHFTMGYMDAPSVYMCEFHTRIVSGAFGKVIDLREAVDDFEDALPLPDDWDSQVTVPVRAPVTSFNISGARPMIRGWKPPQPTGADLMSYFGYDRSIDIDEYEQSFYSQGDFGPAEEDGFYVLDDMATFREEPEESSYYSSIRSEYPRTLKFAAGEKLAQSAVLVSELRDAIDAAVHMDSGEPGYHMDIIKDVVTSLEDIEQRLGEFLSEQQSRE